MTSKSSRCLSLFVFTIIVVGTVFNCRDSRQEQSLKAFPLFVPHTSYSQLSNRYVGFDGPAAVNRLADVENEYFARYDDSISPYYGTTWRQTAEYTFGEEDTLSQYAAFAEEITRSGREPDSMHCTLYAYEGLRVGLSAADHARLLELHRRVYGDHELAGWSVGYLLVKRFDWRAYLVLDRHSREYERCVRAYERRREYPVWRRPAIPLDDLFILGERDAELEELLSRHEFGWGFSYQGWHTWVTRFTELKECNWGGAPGRRYADSDYATPLFLSGPFLQYADYSSHVIVFPPLRDAPASR